MWFVTFRLVIVNSGLCSLMVILGFLFYLAQGKYTGYLQAAYTRYIVPVAEMFHQR